MLHGLGDVPAAWSAAAADAETKTCRRVIHENLSQANFDYESEECSCQAVGAGESQAIEGCGGVLSRACPDAGCCADDPRGACDVLGDMVQCPGVCVAGNSGCFTGG